MPHNRDVLPHQQRRARRPVATQPLRRSKHKMIAGIAAGLAEFIQADPKWVRIIFVLALVLTSGFLVIPYLVLWWLLPKNQ